MLDEIRDRFEIALYELDEACQNSGLPQKFITCNDYGIFIDFAGIEVNYSLYSLTDDMPGYLKRQTERHSSYLRSLRNHTFQTRKDLLICNDSLYSFFLERFFKPSQEELEERIARTRIKIAYDKVLKEGALLGKCFFEEIVVDYTTGNGSLEERRRKLIGYTRAIYINAKRLESLDTDKLHYSSNKHLVWYGKHS